MSSADTILAATHDGDPTFRDAWISLIGRLGGRRLTQPENPLVAVFATPEQAVIACMALLDAPSPGLARNQGVGLHLDHRIETSEAMSGAEVAVALAAAAAPRTACLSLAMRNALAGKIDIGFGAVEDLPLERSDEHISLVRIRGADAPQEDALDESSSAPSAPGHEPRKTGASTTPPDHPSPTSEPDPQPTTILATMDSDLDLTVVAHASTPPPMSRERIVTVTKALSEAESRIGLLIARGAYQTAFEELEQAIRLASEQSATAMSRQRLTARRDELLESVKVTGPGVLRGEGVHAILLPSPVVSLGRSGRDGPRADISLSYALVSRAENGLRLTKTGDDLQIERLGGANSVFVDDTPVDIGQSLKIPIPRNGAVIALGGPADPPVPGDCRLRITRAGKSSSFIECRVDLSHLEDRVSSELEWHWPGWLEDKAKRWIMFEDGLDLGRTATGSLSINPAGANDAGETKARLRYDDKRGYSIEPLDEGIAIDGATTTNPGPLRDGTIVHFGAAKFSFAKPPSA